MRRYLAQDITITDNKQTNNLPRGKVLCKGTAVTLRYLDFSKTSVSGVRVVITVNHLKDAWANICPSLLTNVQKF